MRNQVRHISRSQGNALTYYLRAINSSIYHLVDGEYRVERFRDNNRLNSIVFSDLSLTVEQIFKIDE